MARNHSRNTHSHQTPTPAQREEEERAHHQVMSNLLLTWRRCERAACRRVRACRGDMQACWRSRWRSLTEEDRNWFRDWIKARARGMTVAEAFDHADAEQARHAGLDARRAAGPTEKA